MTATSLSPGLTRPQTRAGSGAIRCGGCASRASGWCSYLRREGPAKPRNTVKSLGSGSRRSRTDEFGSVSVLRHVPGDAFHHALFAATQLDHVAIRVAYKDRDLPAFAKTDRPLRDRDIVRPESGDGRRDGSDAQCHM